MDEQHQQSTVEQAERVVADLEDRRRLLIERKVEMDEARKRVSFDAHTGDGKARKVLDGLNAEAQRHGLDLENILAAIAQAQDRLAAARHAEAVEAARVTGLKVREVNTAALEHSVVLSDALHDALLAINNLKKCWDQFSQAGVASPHHQQLKVNVVNVLSGFLSALPWDFQTLCFSYLPVHQRVDVEKLFRTWHAAIEDRYVRPHVGEAEPPKGIAAIRDDLAIPEFLKRDPPPAEAQP